MTEIFRDTGLGYLFGVGVKKQKPDVESCPSWWQRSQNHELSLKLESARIPATSRCANHHERPARQCAVSKESLSLASTRSGDTETKSEKCAAADWELGWDGPNDPEVNLC